MWRLGSVVREAVLRVTSAGVRSLFTGVALGIVFGIIVWAELAVSTDLMELEERRIERGAYVAVAGRDDGNTFPGSACTRLAASDGVVAAGGFALGERLALAKAPASRIQVVTITGAITEVWSPASLPPAGSGLISGSALPGEMGLPTGVLLASDAGPIQLVGGLEPSARTSKPDRWLLDRAAPNTAIEECWVEFEPGAYDLGVDAVAAALTHDDSRIVVDDLLERGEFSRDPLAEFEGRPQRYWWIGVGLGVGLLSWALAWLRRSDAAIYLYVQMRRATVAALLTMEYAVVVLAAAALAALWAPVGFTAVVAPVGPEQLWVAWRSVALAALGAVMVASAGFVLSTIGQRAAMLKDR